MRIVLTGGGTGGHLIPFEPIIEALRAAHTVNQSQLPARIEPKICELFFVGPADKKTKEFFDRFSVPVFSVVSGKLRRYASILTIIDLLFRLPLGTIIALFRIWILMPDVVVSKGGYGSVPVVVAAIFYRIPILLHESDTVLGLANRLTARFAQAIALPHEVVREALLKKYSLKIFITGIPVRRDLALVTIEQAKKFFAIPETEKVLLVMGGSQGAEEINTVLLEALPSLLKDMAIIHITGEKNFKKVSTVGAEISASSPRKTLYKIFPYLNEKMSYALSAADLVVCRAGATTLAELSSLRKPALVIPLSSAANNHQRKNAELFERFGAVRVLDSANVSRSLFEHAIRAIISSPQTMESLRQGMSIMDHPQAAANIAQLTLTLASGFRPASHD